TYLTSLYSLYFFIYAPAPTEIYTLSLHDALPISKKLQTWIRKCVSGKKDYMNILLNDGEAMVILNEDDTILSIYNPDKRLLSLIDRKSTRLNSSHVSISYAVFCLKKKK